MRFDEEEVFFFFVESTLSVRRRCGEAAGFFVGGGVGVVAGIGIGIAAVDIVGATDSSTTTRMLADGFFGHVGGEAMLGADVAGVDACDGVEGLVETRGGVAFGVEPRSDFGKREVFRVTEVSDFEVCGVG